MILKLVLVLLPVFTWHIYCCTADNTIRSSSSAAGNSLETVRDFRKALLEALERLENEHTPGPVLHDSVSIRRKKEEQDTVVAGRKVHDKQLTNDDEATRVVMVDTLFATTTSSSTDGNNYTSIATITNTVNEQIPVAESHTLLASPKPTAATPVQQAATLQSAEDEEQDETKAKVEDVQFIHAPLVAAFTVQHNDKGLPQKVIPIYGNKQRQHQQQQQQIQINSVRQYQTTLEEKQRALEQQIRVLQEQRRQQELLLLQQQQQFRNSATHTLVTSASRPLQSGTVISLQPSVSYQPSVLLNREHAVPVKSPALFRGAVLQSLPRQYRDNVFNPDNYLKDFYYRQRTLVPPPPRSNRVFRQETPYVGNSGVNLEYDEHHRHTPQHQFNGNYNSILATSPDTATTFIPNQYLQQQQPNIFTSNNRNTLRLPPNTNNVNDRLKNLIFQSGLGQGREQEDLNIVSKVLALDHSATHYPHFLYSESSNVSEKRLPFATFNTT